MHTYSQDQIKIGNLDCDSVYSNNIKIWEKYCEYGNLSEYSNSFNGVSSITFQNCTSYSPINSLSDAKAAIDNLSMIEACFDQLVKRETVISIGQE